MFSQGSQNRHAKLKPDSNVIDALLTLPSPRGELLQRGDCDAYPIWLSSASCDFRGIVPGRSSRNASKAWQSLTKNPCSQHVPTLISTP